MQPNLGQGGCMAIEDAYQLVLDLCREADEVDKEAAAGPRRDIDVEGVLNGYMMVRAGCRGRQAGRQGMRAAPRSGAGRWRRRARGGSRSEAGIPSVRAAAALTPPPPCACARPGSRPPQKRVVRAASIHGMAGMAAYMASTYKAYLGEGLGPLEWITKFKIPHPGRVVGQVSRFCRLQRFGWVGPRRAGSRQGMLGPGGQATSGAPANVAVRCMLHVTRIAPPSCDAPHCTALPRFVLQVIMKATMPGTMSRVLGGYRKSLAQSDRVPVCHLADQPRGFPESLFPLYMEDDDALLRASHAYWVLTPVTGELHGPHPICHMHRQQPAQPSRLGSCGVTKHSCQQARTGSVSQFNAALT